MNNRSGFSGSYLSDDVEFLLKPVQFAPTALLEKERLIQSGARHYSEMIGVEHSPTPDYLAAYASALERNADRLAAGLATLAIGIAERTHGPIQLVSLARAGTPIGVLLTRILRRTHGRDVHHASISIIRDRGVDLVAMRALLRRAFAPPENYAFIDGWTGKGVIADALQRGLLPLRLEAPTLDTRLHVVLDPAGAADIAASTDDWIIPSALLGATVSGLVSRSILNDSVVSPGDFHACVHYDTLRDVDLSRAFVSTIEAAHDGLLARGHRAEPPSPHDRERLRLAMTALVERLRLEAGVSSINHIKPGLGEATRALLRRNAGILWLRDRDAPDCGPIAILAAEKGVPIRVDACLPVQAVAAILPVGQRAGALPREGTAL